MLKLIHAEKTPDLSEKPLARPPSFLQRLFGHHKDESDVEVYPVAQAVNNDATNGTLGCGANDYSAYPYTSDYKSLQSYYGGATNVERVAFMERHHALAAKKMMVSVEQVSIFLTTDNTVISFFEYSADDVEYVHPNASQGIALLTLCI